MSSKANGYKFLELFCFLFFFNSVLLKVDSLPYPIDVPPYSNSLLAYYRFEEDPKNGVAKDSSPNARDASINTTAAYLYHRGRILGSDIMNDGYFFPWNSGQPLRVPLINFPNFPLAKDELTISFLFETRDTIHQIAFSIEFGSQSIVAYLADDFMTLDFFGSKNVTLNTKFQLRALYHFTFVMNLDSLKFYVNGEEASYLQSQRKFSFGSTAKFQLGFSNRKRSYSSSFYDEVIAWNTILSETDISNLFRHVALGPSICTNTSISLYSEDLFLRSDCGTDGSGSLHGKGKSQVKKCGWNSVYRSRGFSCGKGEGTALMNTTAGPYAFRFIDIPENPTYYTVQFNILDLCRTTDPNENMEDDVGLCRKDGKYPVFGICAFDNYCINVGIETAMQRFFFHTGYLLDLEQPMVEFGKVDRPMYLKYPDGAYIYIEMYEDQTLWIGVSNDGVFYESFVQGYRLNLPYPYHYFRLLRFFSASAKAEVGTVFHNFGFFADTYDYYVPEGCPANEFFNGYECQKCVQHSISPPSSVSPDQCNCDLGYFADSCRNSPLCTGTKPGFSFVSMNQPTFVTLIGSASISGELGLLTPNRANQGGGYFFTQPWKLFDFSSPDYSEISFSTHFVFLISDNGGNFAPGNGKWGADGFAFIMSNKIPTTTPPGGKLGYAGLTNSVAVEFDTFKNSESQDISDSHVGININGNMISSKQANYEGLKDSKPIHCWIVYDAAHGVLDIYLATTNNQPVDPLLSYSIEVERIIGGPDMYIGFTAGTGGQYSNHYILRWEFEMTPQLSCSSCKQNYYKDFIGNDECIKCPVGSSTIGTASTDISMCRCEPGLRKEGETCQSCPVNTFNPDFGASNCLPCPTHSSTKGNTGSIMCQCDSGYILENGKCVDFNECSNPAICFNGASCVNRDGSYECICAPGFTGDDCSRDINECTTYPCKNGGTCVNNFGSFTCICPSGWKGNTCMEDIDECALDPPPCTKDAYCTNTIGSYICTCTNGFIGDGKTVCKPPKGPTLMEPYREDIYARYLKLSFIPEQYFNATSLIIEIDFNDRRDDPFKVVEKRTYSVSSTNILLIENLRPYTGTKIRMMAVSGSLVSPASNEIFFRTAAASPDPSKLSYQRGKDGKSALMKWEPGYTNGAIVIGYTVSYHVESETLSKNETTDKNTFSILIKGLTPNITYVFFVVTLASDFPNSNPSNVQLVVVDGKPDVIVVDPPTDAPPSTRKSNLGMIIGICVSLIVVAAIVLFGLIYYKRNRTGRIRLPDSGAAAGSKAATVGLLSPLDDSLNVPDAFKEDNVEEDATEKDIN